MQFGHGRIGAFGLALGLLLCGQTVHAAIYPLEITNIKPVGTAGMTATHRIYKAYPGLVYNIRAAVIGGAFPYTYSLTGAPPGMTINAQTGEINWPSPSGTASPTLAVTDSEGTRVQAAWSIAVSTDGFKFVDAAAGRASPQNGCSSSCGTGAADNPWRSLQDVYRSPSSGNQIVYFKNGTYDISGLPLDSPGSAWERVDFESSTTSCQWIAHPGHTPRIDFQNGPLIRLSAAAVYIDGFETMNSKVMAFQHPSVSPGPTFRRNRFHHHNNAAANLEGSNAAFIMTMRGDSSYTVIQDNEFSHSPEVAIKLYMQKKALIEGNVFHDQTNGIEVKDSIEQFTLRGNTFVNLSSMAIGGNMAADSYPTTGEICFNYVRANGNTIDVNQNGIAGALYIYRNTFVGRVQVRNTGASSGPFTFQNNVIVNNDSGTPSGSHVYHDNVSAPQRVVLVDNLAGSPSQNLVDANGQLTTAYASYRLTHGHGMLSPTPPPPGRPRAPTRVRIIRGN